MDVADDDARVDVGAGNDRTAVKRDRSSCPCFPPCSVPPTDARKTRFAESACGTARTRPTVATDGDNWKCRQQLFGNRGRDGGGGGGD